MTTQNPLGLRNIIKRIHLTQSMQTDFLSIRVMIVSSITLGTWLPIRPAVTYVYTLPLPSVAEHRTQPIA